MTCTVKTNGGVIVGNFRHFEFLTRMQLQHVLLAISNVMTLLTLYISCKTFTKFVNINLIPLGAKINGLNILIYILCLILRSSETQWKG